MRLFSIGLLIVLYLSTSAGLRLQFHYCGGELDYIAVIESGEDCCICHTKAPIGCCSTETLELKSPEKHQVQSAQPGFSLQVFALPLSAIYRPSTGIQKATFVAQASPAQLALPPPDLVVQLSNFRI